VCGGVQEQARPKHISSGSAGVSATGADATRQTHTGRLKAYIQQYQEYGPSAWLFSQGFFLLFCRVYTTEYCMILHAWMGHGTHGRGGRRAGQSSSSSPRAVHPAKNGEGCRNRCLWCRVGLTAGGARKLFVDFYAQCGRANRKSFEVEIANTDFYS
jgi:hypothetical protein